jgi:hypothetical protein
LEINLSEILGISENICKKLGSEKLKIWETLANDQREIGDICNTGIYY